MMRRVRSPRLQRGTRLERKGSRTDEHRWTIAADDQGDARAGAEPIDFGEHAPHRAIASAVACGIDRRHRGRVIEQHDEMLADAGRRQPRAGKNERECQRGQAFKDQARW